MNSFLKQFLLIGKAIGENMVPSIALVENAIISMKSGGDKKAAVIDIIKGSVQTLETVLDKQIVDDPLFIQGIGKVNDGYVDVMNAIKQHSKVM